MPLQLHTLCVYVIQRVRHLKPWHTPIHTASSTKHTITSTPITTSARHRHDRHQEGCLGSALSTGCMSRHRAPTRSGSSSFLPPAPPTTHIGASGVGGSHARGEAPGSAESAVEL